MDPPTGITNKYSEDVIWQGRDPTEMIQKSRLTICCLCLLLLGLVLIMMATMAALKIEETAENVTKRLTNHEEDGKPITFIATKFKVPTTNTFDIFEKRIPEISYQENKKAKFKFPNKN